MRRRKKWVEFTRANILGIFEMKGNTVTISGPIKIGIIGCGAQANIHFDAIEAIGIERATVSGVCDIDQDRLDKAKGRWPQASASKDYKKLLKEADLDLVMVVTMPNTHEEMVLSALRAGAHVLCEKPFMMNVSQAENTLSCAADLGLQVQLGTNMRYLKTSRYLRDFVAGGSLGKPVYFKAWGCHDTPPVWGPHYHLATSGGGVLASTLVHTLDLAVWIAGSPNPISVSASSSRLFPVKRGPKVDETIRRNYDAEDLLSGFVRFDDGSFCSLEGNWCSEVQNQHGFQLTTTLGTVTSTPFSILKDEDGEVVDRTPDLGEDGWGDSVKVQDEDLIDKLRKGVPWDMHEPRQLINLQQIIDACYESAETGQEIRL